MQRVQGRMNCASGARGIAVEHGILALCLAAAIAAANPVSPKFLSEVGSDSIRGQWVEVINELGWNMHGWQIATSQSCCTLECSGTMLVVDSALLARGDSVRGTFRFNPTGDEVRLYGGPGESVSFPSLPASGNTAPAFPSRGSLSCWPWGMYEGNCCWYVDSSPTPGQRNDDYSAISGSLVDVPPILYGGFTVTASGPYAEVTAYADYQYGTFYLGGLSPGKYRVTAYCCYFPPGDTWIGAAPDSIELGYAETRSGVRVYFGWSACESLPLGDRGKRVKDGACLASLDSNVYALKGNRTCEFYRYDTRSDRWQALMPIPALGRLGQSNPVGKGATLCATQGRLYATKGRGTAEFWEFLPDTGQGAWVQRADVPSGSKRLGSGTSSTSLVFNDTTWVYLLRGAGTNELYRYNPQTDSWYEQTGPPLTPFCKTFRTGSAITSDGNHTLYALKGGTDEFYTSDLLTNAWSSLPELPLVGSSRHRRKAGNGASLAYLAGDTTQPGDHVYALKGGNTLESWRYAVGQVSWTQLEDLPLGHHRRVGAGGALTASECMLYALKGSQTLDFLSHPPDPIQVPVATPRARLSIEGNAVHPRVEPALSISPNPGSASPNSLISYSLSEPVEVRLTLHDVTGRVVAMLSDGRNAAGHHSVRVNTTGLRPGVYLVRLVTRSGAQTAKFVKD
jgi:hypothetical protein